MEFEHRKDSGRLMATTSKKHEKSPDYWGEIAIDIKDFTKVTTTKEGYYVFRLNGWKKKNRNGQTYLSLSIDRWVAESKGSTTRSKTDDEDIPF